MSARLAFFLAVAWSPPVFAQQGQAPCSSQVPPQPDQPITFEDRVVVSASRAQEELINAPATG